MRILLPQPGAVFDLPGAAAYLGMTVHALKWHVYTKRDLVPDGRAGDKHPCFTRDTLDTFQATRRNRGRPAGHT
jgi:hypothetical protein